MVSSVHASAVDGSVSDVGLNTLGHGEPRALNVWCGCFEHRVNQPSENSLRVVVLSEQDWEDVNGSIDQFPSWRLESPLALKIAHQDESTEIGRHVWSRNNGQPNEGDFGSTVVAKRCQLALDHQRRNWIGGGILVGDDQFEHKLLGVGLL